MTSVSEVSDKPTSLLELDNIPVTLETDYDITECLESDIPSESIESKSEISDELWSDNIGDSKGFDSFINDVKHSEREHLMALGNIGTGEVCVDDLVDEVINTEDVLVHKEKNTSDLVDRVYSKTTFDKCDISDHGKEVNNPEAGDEKNNVEHKELELCMFKTNNDDIGMVSGNEHEAGSVASSEIDYYYHFKDGDNVYVDNSAGKNQDNIEVVEKGMEISDNDGPFCDEDTSDKDQIIHESDTSFCAIDRTCAIDVGAGHSDSEQTNSFNMATIVGNEQIVARDSADTEMVEAYDETEMCVQSCKPSEEKPRHFSSADLSVSESRDEVENGIGNIGDAADAEKIKCLVKQWLCESKQGIGAAVWENIGFKENLIAAGIFEGQSEGVSDLNSGVKVQKPTDAYEVNSLHPESMKEKTDVKMDEIQQKLHMHLENTRKMFEKLSNALAESKDTVGCDLEEFVDNIRTSLTYNIHGIEILVKHCQNGCDNKAVGSDLIRRIIQDINNIFMKAEKTYKHHKQLMEIQREVLAFSLLTMKNISEDVLTELFPETEGTETSNILAPVASQTPKYRRLFVRLSGVPLLVVNDSGETLSETKYFLQKIQEAKEWYLQRPSKAQNKKTWYAYGGPFLDEWKMIHFSEKTDENDIENISAELVSYAESLWDDFIVEDMKNDLKTKTSKQNTLERPTEEVIVSVPDSSDFELPVQEVNPITTSVNTNTNYSKQGDACMFNDKTGEPDGMLRSRKRRSPFLATDNKDIKIQKTTSDEKQLDRSLKTQSPFYSVQLNELCQNSSTMHSNTSITSILRENPDEIMEMVNDDDDDDEGASRYDLNPDASLETQTNNLGLDRGIPDENIDKHVTQSTCEKQVKNGDCEKLKVEIQSERVTTSFGNRELPVPSSTSEVCVNLDTTESSLSQKCVNAISDQTSEYKDTSQSQINLQRIQIVQGSVILPFSSFTQVANHITHHTLFTPNPVLYKVGEVYSTIIDMTKDTGIMVLLEHSYANHFDGANIKVGLLLFSLKTTGETHCGIDIPNCGEVDILGLYVLPKLKMRFAVDFATLEMSIARMIGKPIDAETNEAHGDHGYTILEAGKMSSNADISSVMGAGVFIPPTTSYADGIQSLTGDADAMPTLTRDADTFQSSTCNADESTSLARHTKSSWSIVDKMPTPIDAVQGYTIATKKSTVVDRPPTTISKQKPHPSHTAVTATGSTFNLENQEDNLKVNGGLEKYSDPCTKEMKKQLINNLKENMISRDLDDLRSAKEQKLFENGITDLAMDALAQTHDLFVKEEHRGIEYKSRKTPLLTSLNACRFQEIRFVTDKIDKDKSQKGTVYIRIPSTHRHVNQMEATDNTGRNETCRDVWSLETLKKLIEENIIFFDENTVLQKNASFDIDIAIACHRIQFKDLYEMGLDWLIMFDKLWENVEDLKEGFIRWFQSGNGVHVAMQSAFHCYSKVTSVISNILKRWENVKHLFVELPTGEVAKKATVSKTLSEHGKKLFCDLLYLLDEGKTLSQINKNTDRYDVLDLPVCNKMVTLSETIADEYAKTWVKRQSPDSTSKLTTTVPVIVYKIILTKQRVRVLGNFTISTKFCAKMSVRNIVRRTRPTEKRKCGIMKWPLASLNDILFGTAAMRKILLSPWSLFVEGDTVAATVDIGTLEDMKVDVKYSSAYPVIAILYFRKFEEHGEGFINFLGMALLCGLILREVKTIRRYDQFQDLLRLISSIKLSNETSTGTQVVSKIQDKAGSSTITTVSSRVSDDHKQKATCESLNPGSYCPKPLANENTHSDLQKVETSSVHEKVSVNSQQLPSQNLVPNLPHISKPTGTLLLRASTQNQDLMSLPTETKLNPKTFTQVQTTSCLTTSQLTKVDLCKDSTQSLNSPATKGELNHPNTQHVQTGEFSSFNPTPILLNHQVPPVQLPNGMFNLFPTPLQYSTLLQNTVTLNAGLGHTTVPSISSVPFSKFASRNPLGSSCQNHVSEHLNQGVTQKPRMHFVSNTLKRPVLIKPKVPHDPETSIGTKASSSQNLFEQTTAQNSMVNTVTSHASASVAYIQAGIQNQGTFAPCATSSTIHKPNFFQQTSNSMLSLPVPLPVLFKQTCNQAETVNTRYRPLLPSMPRTQDGTQNLYGNQGSSHTPTLTVSNLSIPWNSGLSSVIGSVSVPAVYHLAGVQPAKHSGTSFIQVVMPSTLPGSFEIQSTPAGSNMQSFSGVEQNMPLHKEPSNNSGKCISVVSINNLSPRCGKGQGVTQKTPNEENNLKSLLDNQIDSALASEHDSSKATNDRIHGAVDINISSKSLCYEKDKKSRKFMELWKENLLCIETTNAFVNQFPFISEFMITTIPSVDNWVDSVNATEKDWSYTCKLCNKVKMSSLEKMFLHSLNHLHCCRICCKEFNWPSAFSEHFVMSHMNVRNLATPDLHLLFDETFRACHWCGEEGVQHEVLQAGDLANGCEECVFICSAGRASGLNDFRDAIKRHRMYHLFADPDAPFLCSGCNQLFWLKATLVLHLFKNTDCGNKYMAEKQVGMVSEKLSSKFVAKEKELMNRLNELQAEIYERAKTKIMGSCVETGDPCEVGVRRDLVLTNEKT